MKYDAFISYRHLEKDMYVAKKVHKALETTKIPKKIQKEIGRKKINRVFRDQEELPIGSDLGSNIEFALAEAGFLVVICSPKTKESYWVMKEIDTFISMHGRENILAVLVEGEPDESFPEQILKDENGNPVEPLAADVRGKNKKEIRKKLKTETLRLAASILHVDYDDLKQRHRERQMRRNVSIAAGIAAVAVAFGGYTAYNLAKINEEYHQKLVNESKVLAATSLNVLDDGDAKTAALIAMEGIPSKDNDRPYVSDNVYALSQSLSTYSLGQKLEHDLILYHDVNIRDFEVNDEGTRAVSVDGNESVYLWNLDNGERILKKQVETIEDEVDRVADVGFNNGSVIVVTNNYIRSFDEDGKKLYEKQLPIKCTSSTVGFKNKYIAIVGTEYDEDFTSHNLLILIDPADGKEVKRFENSTDISYSGQVFFNSDSSKMIIRHIAGFSDDPITYATVIDLQTYQETVIACDENSILDCNFTPDDGILIATIDSNEMLKTGVFPMHVSKYDVETGKKLWSHDIEYDTSPLNSSYTYIKSRDFDYNGTQVSQVIVNESKSVHVLDLKTGEEQLSIPTQSPIERFYIATDLPSIMVGTYDGNYTYYNGLTGDRYDDIGVKAADTLIEFKLGNGVYVSRGYRCPYLTVMKLKADEDTIVKEDIPYSYQGRAILSPDGETYVISMSDGEVKDRYHFNVIKTDSGEVINSFDVDNPRYMYLTYLDNDTILVPTYGGILNFYDISKGKLDTLPVFEDQIMVSYNISCNKKYAALADYKDYFVVDLEKREIFKSGEADESIQEIAITNDGLKLYSSNVYGDAFCVNTTIGKSKSVFKEYGVEFLFLNKDETLLAAMCKDGYLRVLDLATNEIVDEIEYSGNEYSYAEFSEDNKLLFLQGSDLYFRIYDREKKANVFMMDDQLNDIRNTSYDATNNILAIFNDYEMYLIDLNTCGLLDYAPYGRIYAPEKNIIVTIKGKNLYEFKRKTVDDLVKKVKDRFGDAKLTELEKLKYKIY